LSAGKVTIASGPELTIFLFEKRIERKRVRTKLVQVFGSSAFGQFMFATTFLAADNAQPLQIASRQQLPTRIRPLDSVAYGLRRRAWHPP
jgi:hypothetical protein